MDKLREPAGARSLPCDEYLQDDLYYEPPAEYLKENVMKWLYNIFEQAIEPCIQQNISPFDLLYLPTYQNIGRWHDFYFEWTMFILMSCRTPMNITVRHYSKFKLQVWFSPTCNAPLLETVFRRCLCPHPIPARGPSVFYDTRFHRENHVNLHFNHHILQILTSRTVSSSKCLIFQPFRVATDSNVALSVAVNKKTDTFS